MNVYTLLIYERASGGIFSKVTEAEDPTAAFYSACEECDIENPLEDCELVACMKGRVIYEDTDYSIPLFPGA